MTNLGGDKLTLGTYRVGGVLLGLFIGGLLFGLTVVLMAGDLGLTPFFWFAQAESRSVSVNSIGEITAWIWSVGLTGMQYALLQQGVPGRRKGILAFAGLIMLIDTFTDIGAFNAIFLNDPTAGSQIFLPAGQPTEHYWFSYAAGAACMIHEPVLAILLDLRQRALQRETGESIQAALIYAAGLLLNIVKSASVLTGLASMFLLDALMLPQNGAGKTATIQVGYWIWSGIGTALLVGLWLWYEEKGKEGFRALSKFQKIIFTCVAVYSLVDTIFDLKGFNNMLYGESVLIISDPTRAWLLTFVMVGIICTGSERFGTGIFRPLAKMAMQRSGKGGGDFPSDPGMGGGGMVFDGMPQFKL